MTIDSDTVINRAWEIGHKQGQHEAAAEVEQLRASALEEIIHVTDRRKYRVIEEVRRIAIEAQHD